MKLANVNKTFFYALQSFLMYSTLFNQKKILSCEIQKSWSLEENN